jgi:hypothetical protein
MTTYSNQQNMCEKKITRIIHDGIVCNLRREFEGLGWPQPANSQLIPQSMMKYLG